MRAGPCWLAVLVSGAYLGGAADISSYGPGPAPAGKGSSDSELLLAWPLAANLGWNRTLPMCGEGRKWNQSIVDLAKVDDYKRACYCRRVAWLTCGPNAIMNCCKYIMLLAPMDPTGGVIMTVWNPSTSPFLVEVASSMRHVVLALPQTKLFLSFVYFFIYRTVAKY
eukprot:jgi/Botrbrau1/17706/Bobra.0166s0130.1